MTETIDCTPESLKTPEGRARVDAAQKAFENARGCLEMASIMFFREHLETVRYALRQLPDGEGAAALADLADDIETAFHTRNDASEEFIRAITGIDKR